MVRNFHSCTSWRKFNAGPSVGFKVILIAARAVISATGVDAVLATAAVIGTTFVHIHAVALIPGISQIGFPNPGIVVKTCEKRTLLWYYPSILMADVKTGIARTAERSDCIDAYVRAPAITVAAFVNIYISRDRIIIVITH